MHYESKKLKIAAALIISITLGAASFIRVQGEGYSGAELYFGMFALYLIGMPYVFLLSSQTIPLENKPPTSKFIFLLPAYYILVYLIYSAGTAAFSIEHFGILTAYVLAPSLLGYYSQSVSPTRIGILEIAFILAIWIPVDSGQIQEVWPWPGGVAKNVYTIPMAVVLVSYLARWQAMDGLVFRWPTEKKPYLEAVLILTGFLAVAIPFGFITDFIAFKPRDPSVAKIGLSFILTFLLVGVPEEVLFRGIIQRRITQITGKSWLGLLIAAVIFGFSHFNNGPVPDWRYIFIASIAGVFYGISYLRSGSLVPAILVHTSVDVIWINFFYK